MKTILSLRQRVELIFDAKESCTGFSGEFLLGLSGWSLPPEHVKGR
jgi:hypothetical protein